MPPILPPSLRHLTVHFTPPPSAALAGGTLVVIDTLRATTVITTLLAGGAAGVYPCATPEAARALAASLPGSRLCGERDGLRLDGFAFGNSPAEFATLDVHGWQVVQSTSNGTRALALTRQAATTFCACLRNRAAVAARLRTGRGDVSIVCAGEQNATAPSVEDTFTAGALVAALLHDGGAAWAPDADAQQAQRLFEAHQRRPEHAFAESAHARRLAALGFHADLVFAARMDVEALVPAAAVDAEGRVVVRGRPGRAA